MSSEVIENEKKKGIEFSTFHYVLCGMFFLFILVNIFSLSVGTFKMDVNQNDQNAVKAKQLMGAASIITIITLILIVIFCGVCVNYKNSEVPNVKSYYNGMLYATGEKDIYVAMRVIVFSILMFISLLDAALCLEASKLIGESDDPSQYDSENNLCKELSKFFLFHFALFSVVTVGGYLYQLCSWDYLKTTPEEAKRYKSKMVMGGNWNDQ